MRYFQWWSGNSTVQPNLWLHAMTPDHPKTDQWFSVDSQGKEQAT